MKQLSDGLAGVVTLPIQQPMDSPDRADFLAGLKLGGKYDISSGSTVTTDPRIDSACLTR